MANPQRALLITRNLPPTVGGMERLIGEMANELVKGYRLNVVAPSGTANYLPDGVTGHEVSAHPLPRFLIAATLRAMLAAMRLRPQVVLAGSGLTAPCAYLAARLVNARAAVYLHGLDVEVDSRLYRRVWWPTFRRCAHVMVNSRHTRNLAIDAGIRAEKIRVLHPGVSLPAGRNGGEAFRDRYGLAECPVMLYVGRITQRKGLTHFVTHILPTIIEQVPTARLVVVGDDPQGGLLTETSERGRAERAIARAGLTGSVHFLGPRQQDDPELTAAYQAADVLVFPVQERPHDNEGFGMVALEAAAHGLPTVAFRAGGVADAVADGLSGHLVPAGDDEAFGRATCSLLSKSPSARDLDPEGFARAFEWRVFGSRLRSFLADPQTESDY